MPRPRVARSVLLLSVATFAALAAVVAWRGVLAADLVLRDAILAAAGPALVAVVQIVNVGGTWKVILPGMLLAFALLPLARAWWWLWAGLMLAVPLLETFFKHAVGRARPEGISLGFPSGHATAAAAFFGIVIYLSAAWPAVPRRIVRGLAALTIGVVGTGRVVLGAHWPTDALAGIALGLALASAGALAVATARPARRAS